MKNLIVFLFLLLSANLVAQSDCSLYQQHIEAGDEELQKGYKEVNFDFEKVINSYATAMFLCPKKADEARAKIVKAFKDFGETSFVKIKGGDIDYLIDKKGKEYRAAYKLEDLNSEVIALDLRGTKLNSFPKEILQHQQLQVLILSGNYDNQNNINTLPKEIQQLNQLTHLFLNHCEIDNLPAKIGHLQNLTVLDLVDNQLTTLPAEIGQLQNLTALDLRYNSLTTLPAEIAQLKNLKDLNLQYNNFSEAEKARIRSLVPQGCYVKF